MDFKTYQHWQKVGRYAKQYSLSWLHVLSTVEYNMAVVKQSDADTFLLQTDSAWPVRYSNQTLRGCVWMCSITKEAVWRTVPLWCLGRIQLLWQPRGSRCVKRMSALEWLSVWGSPHVQRKTRPSDWSPLAVTRPLSSAAQPSSPTVPYSADEQVPTQGKKTTGVCKAQV